MNESTSSYAYILKATSIIGGSSIIGLSLRILRTKCLAVLLGPAGMGLIGIYDSITNMAILIFGMGIDISAVRQTAQAAATGDKENIARTITALRRVSILLGIVGMLSLISLSRLISTLTFGTPKYASDIATLSVVLLFGAVSAGQTALIQGMRRIEDLAKLTILGAVFGTGLSVPMIYVWGREGIIIFLIAVAGMNLLASWWYARRIEITSVGMCWANVCREVWHLLRLGSVFMTTSAMANAVTYFVSVLVIRFLGLTAAGLYQAAYSLSIFFVGVILEAMKKDYYPRLTAVEQDDALSCRLVNEQAEVGSLLSMPAVLATLTLGPIIINLFYSGDFLTAYDTLRWQILGVLLLVANWPLGFILMAKGKMKVFFWVELLTNAVHLGLIYLGIVWFGLPGTGMAFFGRNLFYTIFIFALVKRMTGFAWSPANISLALFAVPATTIVFLSASFLSGVWHVLLGGAVTLVSAIYSINRLNKLGDPNGTTPILFKVKARFRFVRG